MYMDTNSDTQNEPFNLIIFTKDTQKICFFTAISIFIIVMFSITPLSQFFKTSFIMKTAALIILVYVILLNYKQTHLLKTSSFMIQTEEIKSQLNTNIICSYVFIFFIGLLIIYTFKSIIMPFIYNKE